jgi:hypothetical protein
MKQNIKTDAGHDLNQQKVFHHLRLADILLIVLPMALVIITLLVFTVTCGSDLMCVGVALASFIIAFLFCVIYGALSLILSHPFWRCRRYFTPCLSFYHCCRMDG